MVPESARDGKLGQRSTVAIYTSHSQTEQPLLVHDVTAIALVGGLLTVEHDVQERDYTFSGHRQFQNWTRFEVVPIGRSTSDG